MGRFWSQSAALKRVQLVKSLLIKFPWAIGAVALLLAFTIVGCQSDADHIRATNQASSGQAATSTPLSAVIHTVDIQEGDCIDSTLPEGISIETVMIVVCSGPWQYRALNSFLVDEQDNYPGEDYFSKQAYERCDRRYSTILFPIAESWAISDRTVDCLQHSFGLSDSDPNKLDRLVRISSLISGQCFNEAPETDSLLVELVPCTGEWERRVVNSFGTAESDSYPGAGFFRELANERCDRRTSSRRIPSKEVWGVGDRTVTCLQDSFGLSVSDPAKLDRLVRFDSLSIGECFNDAHETEGLLVELVNCSGDWELQVTHRFSVPQDDEYPGDDYFLSQAELECGTDWDFYYSPSVESWELGDRVVTCTKSSDPTTATEP